MDAASAAGRVNGQQSNGLQPGVGQQVGLPPGLAGNLSGLRSAFHAVPPGPQPQALYPEIALFSQLGQLFPQAAELQMQQQQHGTMPQQPTESGRGNARTKSSDSKASSAYASRHQAAEQRRRTRINERYSHVLPELLLALPFCSRPTLLPNLADSVVVPSWQARQVAVGGTTRGTSKHSFFPGGGDQVYPGLAEARGRS